MLKKIKACGKKLTTHDTIILSKNKIHEFSDATFFVCLFIYSNILLLELNKIWNEIYIFRNKYKYKYFY